MQKGRLKSPQKLPIQENQAFLVIFVILAQPSILVILVSHFRTRVDTPKQSSPKVLLALTRPSYFEFCGVYTHRKPEARQQNEGGTGGLGRVVESKEISAAFLMLQAPRGMRVNRSVVLLLSVLETDEKKRE